MSWKKTLNYERFFLGTVHLLSLIWMFHNRPLNHKINRLHERCLRIVYDDNCSSCEELLITDSSSFSIHHRSLQFLATEMFRVYKGSASDVLNEVFPLNPDTSYSLRNQQTFATRTIQTVHYRSNSLSSLGPKTWEMVPSDIKNLGTVKAFKFPIKSWLPENCSCRLCKLYVYQVDLLWVFNIFCIYIKSFSSVSVFSTKKNS